MFFYSDRIYYMSSSLLFTLKKSYYFLFSQEKKKILTLLFLVILIGVTPSIDSILLQKITDLIESYSNNNPNNLSINLVKWAIFYALWWESINIIWRLYDYIYLKTLPKIKTKLIDEFYNHVQDHSQDFFQTNLAGDITNKITEASRSLEMIFSFFTEKILRKLAVITFALITLYYVHYFVANIFLIWIIFFIIMSMYFAKTINKYSADYGKDKAAVSGSIVDSIANISVIRMFTSRNYERKFLAKYLNKSLESDQKMQWFMLKLRYTQGLLCSIMILAMIYYILLLRSQNLITIGDCVLIIALCVAVVDDIYDLTQEFGDFFEQVGIFDQALDLIKNHSITDKLNARTLNITNSNVEFKNVTFCYHRNNNIFNNKSIFIEARQKVGLAGFSGSGKTTFANLIARIFDIESGKIMIDGQNIANVTQDSLRQNISIIPQEPILFHRSIMENIKYGKPKATDYEVFEVAKSSYIHDFITKLPDGYNTLCGERGNNLSGGQRQRIIIARAILKDAPIVILDEATSSLDSKTEEMIQKSLNNLMKNRTVFVIAHKLSTLLNMDRILVFDNGNIVEDGTHKQLKHNGKIYQELWDTQIKKT